MRKNISCLGACTIALLIATAGTASAATTIGSTTPELNSTLSPCVAAGGGGSGADVIVQSTDDGSTTPYHVPSNGLAITRWSTNTSQDTAGATLTLVILRPLAGGGYRVVATDPESLPTPLPNTGVALFTLPHPVLVQAGDTLGLYSDDTANTPTCIWHGTNVPQSDSLEALSTSGVPAAGQKLSVDTSLAGGAGPGESGPGFQANVAVTLVQTKQDASVSSTANPSAVTVGNLALLSATVHNNGPGNAPVRFTDTVPAGLKIDSVAAGSGICSVSGQRVTCTISNLASAHSAPVDIVVTANSAGAYTNHVAVAPVGVGDPRPANNSSSASLRVKAPAQAHCVVPQLKGAPLSVAKNVLQLLGCNVGKTSRTHSSTARGDVVRTSPGPGSYPAGTKIAVIVSAG